MNHETFWERWIVLTRGFDGRGWRTSFWLPKYPDIWAGIVAAAPYRPANFGELVQQFKQMPTRVLQSEADELIPPASTRELVAKMKELGLQVVYIEFKDGDHSLFMSKNRDNLSRVFSFFNIAQKNQRQP